MSNKLRILRDKDNPTVLHVQQCNPGRPWSTIKTYEGTGALQQIASEYPKARFR